MDKDINDSNFFEGVIEKIANNWPVMYFIGGLISIPIFACYMDVNVVDSTEIFVNQVIVAAMFWPISLIGSVFVVIGDWVYLCLTNLILYINANKLALSLESWFGLAAILVGAGLLFTNRKRTPGV